MNTIYVCKEKVVSLRLIKIFLKMVTAQSFLKMVTAQTFLKMVTAQTFLKMVTPRLFWKWLQPRLFTQKEILGPQFLSVFKKLVKRKKRPLHKNSHNMLTLNSHHDCFYSVVLTEGVHVCYTVAVYIDPVNTSSPLLQLKIHKLVYAAHDGCTWYSIML